MFLRPALIVFKVVNSQLLQPLNVEATGVCLDRILWRAAD